MKIGIVGSRTFEDYDILKKFVLESIDINEVEDVVSGGAIGADTLAEMFSLETFGKEAIVHEPDYKKWGRYFAPKLRNTLIAEESDVLIAFWNGFSSGTKDTIDKAKKLGKKVYIYKIEVLD